MRVQQIKQIRIGSIPELKPKPQVEGSVAELLVFLGRQDGASQPALTSMLTFVLALGES